MTFCVTPTSYLWNFIQNGNGSVNVDAHMEQFRACTYWINVTQLVDWPIPKPLTWTLRDLETLALLGVTTSQSRATCTYWLISSSISDYINQLCPIHFELSLVWFVIQLSRVISSSALFLNYLLTHRGNVLCSFSKYKWRYNKTLRYVRPSTYEYISRPPKIKQITASLSALAQFWKLYHSSSLSI